MRITRPRDRTVITTRCGGRSRSWNEATNGIRILRVAAGVEMAEATGVTAGIAAEMVVAVIRSGRSGGNRSGVERKASRSIESR